MGRLRGSVVVQTLCLWRRNLPAIPTGSRWGFYTHSRVYSRPYAPANISLDAARRRPQPLPIGSTTAKGTKQPRFRDHDKTIRSRLPSPNCYSQSRKHGAGLQLSMGAQKCRTADWVQLGVPAHSSIRGMRHQTKRGWRQQRAREHLSGHCLTNSTSKAQSRFSSRPTNPCIHRFRLACIRHHSAQPLREPVMTVSCKLSHLRLGRWASTVPLPQFTRAG